MYKTNSDIFIMFTPTAAVNQPCELSIDQRGGKSNILHSINQNENENEMKNHQKIFQVR